jgi:hypothetical protein
VTDLPSTEFADTDARIDFAQRAAREADLTVEQVAGMQAYLLGATLTHFDEAPIVPMTGARWRRIVHAAIEHVSSPGHEGGQNDA